MSATNPGPIRKAWYRWKSLRLPWRKRFLVGLDLQGNTFWEFKETLSSQRMRRIVKYPPATQHSDLDISPQWHQWLRHTRFDPPSLTEQAKDVVRLQNLKVLAAQADRRWREKGSVLDAPRSAPLVEAGKSRGVEREAVDGSKDGDEITPGGEAQESEVSRKDGAGLGSKQRAREKEVRQEGDKDDPWKQARGGPSEGWQPTPWDGNITVQRR